MSDNTHWPKDTEVGDAKGDVIKARRRTDEEADAELRTAHAYLARAEMRPDDTPRRRRR